MKRCKICGGTGVIYDQQSEDGPHGNLRVCDCIEKQCVCGAVPPYQVFNEKGEHSWCFCRGPRLRLYDIKQAFRESQIPVKYKWKFREDFKIVTPKANKIIGFVDTIKDKTLDQKWKDGFYLWGPAGSGKTLLACIFLHELILKYALGGRFVDLSRQFFQRLKNSFDLVDESYGTAGQILDELIEIPFLVIDDFGTQRNTEWELEMLYNLIDSRYEEDRITIITSNSNIAEYKDIAKGRIYSRIIEMCKIIHVDLPDYREGLSQYL
jgi:DNA replication protein DnaC